MTLEQGDILTTCTTEDLRERRSVKWREYPPDVLPVHIAEMDTPLAEPITAALLDAVGRGDTGYATAARLGEAFAGFAARHYGWHPDPTASRLVPDVMAGIVEVLGTVCEPGDARRTSSGSNGSASGWSPARSPAARPGTAWTWTGWNGTSPQGRGHTCYATRTTPPAWC